MKRLTIVVPYRDRPSQLKEFIGMVGAYFARDKVDRHIPYQVFIIEQEAGLQFNIGALRNIGFELGHGESDYTCFHDVDYLPIWADYSWSDVPTCLVWYGAETRPISKQSKLRVRHDLEHFYGGVTLTPNALFVAVDGYANDYWGWGYEDLDLKTRFQRAGIPFGHRKGTFRPLDHGNRGFLDDGQPTEEAVANRRRFDERWSSQSGMRRGAGGLTTMNYEILRRDRLSDPALAERPARWELVKVRLKQ